MRASGTGTFAVRLRELRERAGLTQEELAERAGLTPHAVSALERGTRTRPYPHTVRSLSDALELDDDARAGLLAAVPRRRDTPVEPPPAEIAELPVRSRAAGLPVPATPLLGRDLEVLAVTALVLDPEVRLVTLTGLGGVGKTRLALAVAQHVQQAHGEQVVWVPLAQLSDPRLVLPAIGYALGLAGVEGGDALALLSGALRDRTTLLVLDNLEHLLEAAPDVAALLHASPGTTVLASSRAPLRLRGEHEHTVPPLEVPAGVGFDAVVASPAVTLLVERARSVQPGFSVTPQNADDVASICARLAGIPLALELAAAKTRFLDPAALLARLDAALSGDGARDLPPRQRTMRATLDWSYELLDEAQQRLYRRLGAFAGGFTLDAAEVLVEPGEDVVGLLERLVEHSLVQVRADDDGLRYSLLEPVLQHARLLLGDGAEARAAHLAHAGYFLALAEDAVPAYRSDGAVTALARGDREEANFGVALERTLAHGRADLTGRLGWALWLYWWLRGHLLVGRRAMEQALEHELPPYVRIRAALACSAMAFAQGDLAGSAPGWDTARTLAVETDDVPGQAHGTAGRGLVALASGDLDAAEAAFTATLPLAAESDDDRWLWTLAHVWLGTVALLRGSPRTALDLIQPGLADAARRGDRLATYIGLFTASQAALALGELATARRQLEEGIALSVETGDAANLAYFLDALAVVESQHGEHQRVATLLGAAQALRATVGSNVYGYYQPDEGLRDDAASRAREALGAEGYAEAAARGRGLDAAGAAELALQVRRPDRPHLRLA